MAFQFYDSSSDTLSHAAIKLVKPIFEYSSNARAQDLITVVYALLLGYPVIVSLESDFILSIPQTSLCSCIFFRDGKHKDSKI